MESPIWPGPLDTSQESDFRDQLLVLSSIAERNSNGVVISDAKGCIEWVNRSFEEISGYTLDELKGKKPGHVLQGPGTSAETVAYLADRLHRREPFMCEILNYHKSGRPYWVRLLGQALLDAEGKVLHFFSIEEDITEWKLSADNLRTSENRLSTLILNLKEGILLEDENRRIVLTNQPFCDMFGIPVAPAMLTGADCSRSADQNKHLFRDPDEFVRRITQILDERKSVLSEELELADGKFYERDYIPLLFGNDLKGHLWKYADITERKVHEAELRIAREKAVESARAKEIFLASMSHEIRTPLNAIIGLVREIAREPLSPKQERYIRNAGLASQHLLSIVNDILDITKIESGQLNLEIRTFAMQQLIDATAAILTPEAVDKNLDLSIDTGPGLAPAYIGDGSRIKQVLLNILNNAIKFTDKGSVSITCDAVSVAENRHRVSILVADTGIGMEPAFLEHIFDKFSQGEASTARRYGGTGLGLSITHELIQLMGGRIEVSSTKGEGTLFTVVLDLETGDPADLEPDASTGSFAVLAGWSVLLVEDNDLNRLVAENSLTHCGMRVTGAHNGAEALEILKERRFDIILMDLQMPIMNGLDATTFLRREMEIATPVIALTANAFKAELDRCLEAGMNDYITKPFEESVLLSAILRNIGPAPAAAPRGSLPTADGEPLYNLEYIVQFSRDNPEFVRKMVNLFIEQVPASVTEIREALAAGDLPKAAAVAHRIKPNIDSFGIVLLKQEIRDLEARAQEQAPKQELNALADHIEQVIGCVVQQLRKDVL